jgi:hypothetical protein
VLTYTPL